MTDLPPGWELVRLDQIAEVRLGRQRSPKNHTGTHMRPYLRAANVDWNGLKLDDVKEMNFTEAEAEVYRLRPGDLILSEASGSPGEVGKPALWNSEIEDCCFQNTLIRVRSHGVNPNYLLYFFRSEALSGAFAANTRGVGIHHLGAARLSAWKIPIPPLSEQQRIVAALEDHLTRLHAARTTLSSSSRRLASLTGRTRTTYLVGRKNAEDDQPTLPKGWRWGSLGEILDGIEAGKSFTCEPRQAQCDEWGVIKVSAMTWGEFRENENKAVPIGHKFDRRNEIKSGDILVSRANTADYVGAPVLVKKCRPKLLLSDKSLRLRIRENFSKGWLIELLSSPFVRAQISAKATGTKDSMRNISQRALTSVAIPIPPSDAQVTITAQLQEILGSAARLEGALETARLRSTHLHHALLTTAFAGRLVPQDPADEPADELLARIHSERQAQAKSTRTRRAAAQTSNVSTSNAVQETLL